MINVKILGAIKELIKIGFIKNLFKKKRKENRNSKGDV